MLVTASQSEYDRTQRKITQLTTITILSLLANRDFAM